jgi:hypothetical protein
MIGGSAFYGCTNLTTADFPVAIMIGSSAFYNCSSLAAANFPVTTTIESYVFYGCSNLTTANFPVVTTIGSFAFRGCKMLTELHLDNVESVPMLKISAFYSTPIGGYSAIAGQYGSVFVPGSLYESFLTANNWSSIASRIVSV